eukprot:11191706-Lingulodinium_polyedra.AAC.1
MFATAASDVGEASGDCSCSCSNSSSMTAGTWHLEQRHTTEHNSTDDAVDSTGRRNRRTRTGVRGGAGGGEGGAGSASMEPLEAALMPLGSSINASKSAKSGSMNELLDFLMSPRCLHISRRRPATSSAHAITSTPGGLEDPMANWRSK